MTPPQLETIQVPTRALPRTRPHLRPFPLSLDRSFMFSSRPRKFQKTHTDVQYTAPFSVNSLPSSRPWHTAQTRIATLILKNTINSIKDRLVQTLGQPEHPWEQHEWVRSGSPRQPQIEDAPLRVAGLPRRVSDDYRRCS